MGLYERYQHWLHPRWPAGSVEKLPVVGVEGVTNVPGLRIAGDLSGIPLLKLAADSGARAVRAILAEKGFTRGDGSDDVLDLAIVGAGVAGVAAAIEARKAGLRMELFEAAQPFHTIRNFPKGKPIFSYPSGMRPAGEVDFGPRSTVKEGLLEELEELRAAHAIEPTLARIVAIERAHGLLVLRTSDDPPALTRARRVIVAIGRSGSYRKLGVPGQQLDKVYHRLYDPAELHGQDVLVVGGGDSALESAIALATCGADVTLSHRKAELTRPKPENTEKLTRLVRDEAAQVAIEQPRSERVGSAAFPAIQSQRGGSLRLLPSTEVKAIRAGEVDLVESEGTTTTLPNDAVFAMIGREPPLDFLRRSGVAIHGERSTASWLGLAAFLLFATWLYHWKSYGFTGAWMDPAAWTAALGVALGDAVSNPTSLLHTLLRSASGASFYYTLAYSLCVLVFGIRRMRLRSTPYVRRQTIALMCVQWLPLFLLPEIVLPWLGRNGFFLEGAALRPIADLFFESYDGGIGIERAYWRSYGLILAWPLMVYNWFTPQPMWGWLVLGSLQSFVIIPWMVRRWGKGAMCSWLCSCGALAETLGDGQRHKMPHGPAWNRLNMLGQWILAAALLLMALRIWGWAAPGSWAARHFDALVGDGVLSYKYLVDLLLAGIIGVGLYFHYSGRVWCRFACPLAALMNIYGRFSRFRIFPDKKKCISCNLCTAVCHQGIDVMSFANKGVPMEDPQCVRCSACVHTCPTGTLAFGRYGRGGDIVLDRLAASPVRMRE